jgi:rhodanese-related sulfurtransferase
MQGATTMKPLATMAVLILVLASLYAAVAVAAPPAGASVAPEALLERQRVGDPTIFVLDVRTPDEYAAGHIPGALNVPHDALAARLDEIPKDRDVVLYCRTGRRAALAAEVLAAHGYSRVVELEGDMVAWEAQERPIERPRDPRACAAALTARRGQAESCAL